MLCVDIDIDVDSVSVWEQSIKCKRMEMEVWPLCDRKTQPYVINLDEETQIITNFI